MGFNPKNYTTVDERLVMYRKDNPDYRVFTEVTFRSRDEERITIKATVFKNAEDQQAGLYHTTGIASENYEGYVNETSRDENCETSAIGRALANAGYTGKGGRPSREEMEKVKRMRDSKSKDVDPAEDEHTKKKSKKEEESTSTKSKPKKQKEEKKEEKEEYNEIEVNPSALLEAVRDEDIDIEQLLSDDETVIANINVFDKTGELVQWFNSMIKAMASDDADKFKDTYIESTQKRMSELS